VRPIVLHVPAAGAGGWCQGQDEGVNEQEKSRQSEQAALDLMRCDGGEGESFFHRRDEIPTYGIEGDGSSILGAAAISGQSPGG
jgi:hypothetical protein